MAHIQQPWNAQTNTSYTPHDTALEEFGSGVTRKALQDPFADPVPRGRRLHPRNWTRRTWAISIVAGIIIIAIVIIVSIEETKNAYPDYKKLNYDLVDTYAGEDFFNNFDYFTGTDPDAGHVIYVSQDEATSSNLTQATADAAFLRVDTTDDNATKGRKSVRVSSKKTYDSGLFVWDLLRTPYGCGIAPSIFLGDQNLDLYPSHGEIDVVEAVNVASNNEVTLRTSGGCEMDHKRKQSGQTLTKNCNGTENNGGCGVAAPAGTYGLAVNDAGGAIYAMELRKAGIRIFHFARNAVPADLFGSVLDTNSTDSSDTAVVHPDPSQWGEPLADFPSTGCDIQKHFVNQSIIMDIDLCGSWAGSAESYSDQNHCFDTCETYVTENGQAFLNAYWEIASLKVYQAPNAD